MKVVVLTDPGNADGTWGGAELTMREFADAAPEGVDLGNPDAVAYCDTVVLGNCVTFGPSLISEVRDKRVVWFHNDLTPHLNPELKAWLDDHATHVFCSPLQQERYGQEGHLIPPPIDLERFEQHTNGSRQGTVALGSWHNPGKGQQQLLEWSEANDPVDVYGAGSFVPHGPTLTVKGSVEPDEVPGVLHAYSQFVHLPTSVEPFGRGVVEAWASGLKLVVNRLVGATWWIRERPDALRTASRDFWRIVLDDSP